MINIDQKYRTVKHSHNASIRAWLDAIAQATLFVAVIVSLSVLILMVGA